MNDFIIALPWFGMLFSIVICTSVNNDRIALEKTNEKLHEQQVKIESQNDNLKDSIITCQSELKGYTNGSK